MALLLTATIFCLLLLLTVVYYIIFPLLRHKRLVKEYRNISFLPLSSIPFVGNIHLIDKRPDVFFHLIFQLAKQAHDKTNGIFCLWYSLWPMVFICSGRGLEVYSYPIIFMSKYFLFHLSSPLSIIANNLLNLLITLLWNPGLKLVYLLGNTSAIQTSYFLYH
jgi:hypothetical protein